MFYGSHVTFYSPNPWYHQVMCVSIDIRTRYCQFCCCCFCATVINNGTFDAEPIVQNDMRGTTYIHNAIDYWVDPENKSEYDSTNAVKRWMNNCLSHELGTCIKNRYQAGAGTCNHVPQILCDVVTCPCPWYYIAADNYSAMSTIHDVLVLLCLVQASFFQVPYG